MAGTYKTRAELFTDGAAPFATAAVPTNQDFQDLGASYHHLADLFVPAGDVRTLQSTEYFAPADGSLFLLDPGGVDRDFNPNPDETFPTRALVMVVNTADAAESITFDSLGLAAVIGQGEGGIFAFDGSNWWRLA